MIDSRTGKQYQTDGGPAFGNFYQIGDKAVTQGGMTLRDYFAAKAMSGLVASHDGEDFRLGNEDLAVCAYAVADAMIAARGKP